MKCNKCKKDVFQTFDEQCIECYDVPDDHVVNTVIDKYKERMRFGFLKYKTNLMRQDLNTIDWLNHLQEELMDATLYLQRLRVKLESIEVSKNDEEDLHFKLSEQGYFEQLNNNDNE